MTSSSARGPPPLPVKSMTPWTAIPPAVLNSPALRLTADLPLPGLRSVPGVQRELDQGDSRAFGHLEHDATQAGAACRDFLGYWERVASHDVFQARVEGLPGGIHRDGTVRWRIRVRAAARVVESELHGVEPVTLPGGVELGRGPRVVEYLDDCHSHLLPCAAARQDDG